MIPILPTAQVELLTTCSPNISNPIYYKIVRDRHWKNIQERGYCDVCNTEIEHYE